MVHLSGTVVVSAIGFIVGCMRSERRATTTTTTRRRWPQGGRPGAARRAPCVAGRAVVGGAAVAVVRGIQEAERAMRQDYALPTSPASSRANKQSL